jgi:hypothetical protein
MILNFVKSKRELFRQSLFTSSTNRSNNRTLFNSLMIVCEPTAFNNNNGKSFTFKIIDYNKQQDSRETKML